MVFALAYLTGLWAENLKTYVSSFFGLLSLSNLAYKLKKIISYSILFTGLKWFDVIMVDKQKMSNKITLCNLIIYFSDKNNKKHTAYKKHIHFRSKGITYSASFGASGLRFWTSTNLLHLCNVRLKNLWYPPMISLQQIEFRESLQRFHNRFCWDQF